jgi:tyrosyl-tRNA synthetase
MGENLPTLSAGGGISVLSALTGLGFCASNGEAKRKIAEGAVRVDDQVVSDPALTISVGDAPVKLSLGKKRHALLVR